MGLPKLLLIFLINKRVFKGKMKSKGWVDTVSNQ